MPFVLIHIPQTFSLSSSLNSYLEIKLYRISVNEICDSKLTNIETFNEIKLLNEGRFNY